MNRVNASGLGRTSTVLSNIGFSRLTQAITVLLLWLAWGGLWYLPWQMYAPTLPWLRLGIAVLLFILPGLCVWRLLRRETQTHFVDDLTVGFSLSVALTAALGVIAKFLELPFGFVTHGSFAIGTLALAALAVKGIPLFRRAAALRIRSSSALELLPLIAALLLVGRLLLSNGLYADDFWYGALLTNYRGSTALGFSDFFFGLDRLTPTRFWIAFWPLSEAVLATLSDLPGIELIGSFIAPVLGVLSLLAVFGLARAFAGRKVAQVAVVAQVAALASLVRPSEPGWYFFNRLTQDKEVAAFVLSPIFLRLAIEYLRKPAWQGLTLVGLALWGLILTHPTIAGVACLVTVLYGGLELLLFRNWRAVALLVGLVVLMLLIPFSLRFFPNPYWNNLPFGVQGLDTLENRGRIARLWVLPGTPFYGTNPDLMLGVAFWLALCGGVLALWRIRQSEGARYLLASQALVIAALVPYTGWIIGLAVTPFQVHRVTWLMPFGVGIAFLFAGFAQTASRRFEMLKRLNPQLILFLIILSEGLVLAAAASSLTVPLRAKLAGGSRFHRWRHDLGDASQIARQLDLLIPEQALVIGGDKQANDLIPGLSAKAKVLVFGGRNELQMYAYLSREEAATRWNAWRAIVAENSSDDRRLQTLGRYQLQFILFKGRTSWAERLATEHPEHLRLVSQAGRYYLYAYNAQ